MRLNNKARVLFNKVCPEFLKYDPTQAQEEIEQMEERGKRDVLDKKDWGYYQFLPCLMRVVKPEQVIELGGAMGVSTLMMLSALPKTSKLFSITLEEHGLEFSYIKKNYPNLIKVIGDDLDLSVWPKECQLEKTKIWFIDSTHTESQLRAETKNYQKFWKKGTIILVDDVRIDPGYYQAWLDLPGDKLDASILHSPSGFGITIL